MNISDNGINLIKSFEGLRLKAYQDSAGVWTIGWGSTYYANGNRVKPGDTLPSRQAADDLFLITLKSYDGDVNRLVKVPLTQNQHDALVDFEYNTGALAASSALILLNGKEYALAADHLLSWNKITDPKTKEKVICPDLVKRRAAERVLFLKAA